MVGMMVMKRTMVEQYNKIVRNEFHNRHEANEYFESPEYQTHVEMIGKFGLNTFTNESIGAFLIVNYKPFVKFCLKYAIGCSVNFATNYLHYDADAFDLFFKNLNIPQNENYPYSETVRSYVLACHGFWHKDATSFTYARLINKEFAHFSFINYQPYRDFCKQYQLQKRASLAIIHETQCDDFARSCAELVFADEYIVGRILLFF